MVSGRVAIPLLLLAGCGEIEALPPCATSDDCGDGDVCHEARCVRGDPSPEPDAAVAEPDAAVAEPDAAVAHPEACNGADDDLDGRVDEGTAAACGLAETCLAGQCQQPEGFTRLAPGAFWMGSPADEGGPRHQVRITRPFLLETTEVTQGEWRSVARAEGWAAESPAGFDGCDACPVESVSWFAAVAYCNALSRAQGLETCYVVEGCGEAGPGSGFSCARVEFSGITCRGYRLPTEAEWEYAARGQGADQRYPWGDAEATCARAVMRDGGDGCGPASTWPVCSRPEGHTAQGLCDMAGNVGEWVGDWHAGDYGGVGVFTDDPEGPALGVERIDRGGAWFDEGDAVGVAHRERHRPDLRDDGLGFRLARSLPGETCNGIDDDLDGAADEGEDGAPLRRPCYGGSRETLGVGLCEAGAQTCDEGDWGPCEASIEPTEEVCDGEDQDCDGIVDEGTAAECGAGETCLDGACGPPAGYVRLAPGTFWMGSPEEEPHRQENEARHEVRITRPFLMKATEVTQAEWRAVAQAAGWEVENPARAAECGGGCPVEKVNWFEAAAYCNALSQLEGLPGCYVLDGCGESGPGQDMECAPVEAASLDCEGYRLPTEAEWEYAARSQGLAQRYPWGDEEETCELAVMNDRPGQGGGGCGQRSPWPVCSRPPGHTAQGLCDMGGNVWEWVEDRYAVDYGGLEAVTVDPRGAVGGPERVHRGGCWNCPVGHLRVARRTKAPPGDSYVDLGFRPARTLSPRADGEGGLCEAPTPPEPEADDLGVMASVSGE